jgi:hypothetical protein
MIRVLIGCEFSGAVRDAFRALGCDAWSCDLLPTERPGPHIQGDVRDHLADGWDMLIVCNPPCTRLCRSGRRWMSGPGKWTPPKSLPKGRDWADLRAEFELGVDVFTTCWTAPIPRVAIENPEMNDLARDRMPADLLAHALALPEVARMVEAERERCIMAFTNGRMDATYIDLHGIELEDLLAELRAGGAA